MTADAIAVAAAITVALPSAPVYSGLVGLKSVPPYAVVALRITAMYSRTNFAATPP